MSTELWAAIIGSAVLIVGGGVGTLFWTHMSDLKKTAEEAQKAAADAQLARLQDAALFAADLKRVELALYEHKLEVANRHIKREDFNPVLTEIFAKIEGLSERFDVKLEAVVRRLESKQDRRGVAA